MRQFKIFDLDIWSFLQHQKTTAAPVITLRTYIEGRHENFTLLSKRNDNVLCFFLIARDTMIINHHEIDGLIKEKE